MKNYNQMHICYLMRQDLNRIRHEVALLSRSARAEQKLNARLIEQQTGGALTAKQLDKIETEQKQKLTMEHLTLLARAVNCRLHITFEPVEEDDQNTGTDWDTPAQNPIAPLS